jgi:hypothetical protein
MITIQITFRDTDDARNFKKYAEKARATGGTVVGLYSGLACSAIKHAVIEDVQRNQTPYSRAALMENLQLWEQQLAKYKPTLKGGPGYVLHQIRDLLKRGIAC